MAAYRRAMTLVTCRLTAKNRDQLLNPTLGNRVWATCAFFPTSTNPRHSKILGAYFVAYRTDNILSKAPRGQEVTLQPIRTQPNWTEPTRRLKFNCDPTRRNQTQSDQIQGWIRPTVHLWLQALEWSTGRPFYAIAMRVFRVLPVHTCK